MVGMREMGSFVQNSGPECSLLQNNFPTLQGWGMGIYIYIYDLVPKGVHENRTKGVENKVDDTLKLVVFLDWAQC